MKPRTQQEQQSYEKKEHLFHIALKLFNEYGYEQTTVRQICTAANMTTGSFYNFFHDKLGLIRYLYVKILEEGSSFLDDTKENLERPFQSIYNYFIQNTSIYADFNPQVAQQIHTEASRLLGGAFDAPEPETGKWQLSAFIRKAQEYGSIPTDLDAEKTAIYLIAVSMGCTNYWIYRSRNVSLRDAAETILRPAFRAITDEPLIFPELGHSSFFQA